MNRALFAVIRAPAAAILALAALNAPAKAATTLECAFEYEDTVFEINEGADKAHITSYVSGKILDVLTASVSVTGTSYVFTHPLTLTGEDKKFTVTIDRQTGVAVMNLEGVVDLQGTCHPVTFAPKL
jgi:hypothetical protein